MSRHEAPIARRAAEPRERGGPEPGMAPFQMVAIGCGSATHGRDGATAAASGPRETETIRRGVPTRKPGLGDGPRPMEGLA